MRLNSFEKSRLALNAANAKDRPNTQVSVPKKVLSRRLSDERFQQIDKIISSMDASPEITKLKMA